MHATLAAAAALLLAHCGASPLAALEARQSCPSIHIFGARETTASPGYGSSSTVVNLILNAYPGSTAEAVSYPACGGQSSCGGASYSSSASQGTQIIAQLVNSYYAKCPSTQLVIVGYSQGGEITDNAVCGGNDSPQGITSTSSNTISSAALAQVKVVIEMGSPRYVSGSSYNVGTCKAQGFSARPSGYNCPSASKIRSYCDSADPYCCTGNDANVHQGYGSEYGQNALAFAKTKLNQSGGSTTTTTRAASTTTTRAGTTSAAGTTATSSAPAATTTGSSSGGSAQWGQCGGSGWSGPTSCVSPYTCHVLNPYYSQCY
ncbi:hypothetical protein B0A48_01433 [Cryoendolithus antarcticus]|uniref:CBM1 domain-containing protein n=1 Tax=Cryoendolithus antarcticus TaxID=1507870 RepID=A0A1V8TT69_9PEZI|nr:hypothetical protein B0A48_01433 [Cryoendolithus antarcticus]